MPGAESIGRRKSEERRSWRGSRWPGEAGPLQASVRT